MILDSTVPVCYWSLREFPERYWFSVYIGIMKNSMNLSVRVKAIRQKEGLSSSLFFYIHCLQKVWPIFRVDLLIQVKWSRFKVGLSILNDPIKNDSSWVWNLEPQTDWVLVIPYVVKFMTKNSHHWGVLGEWRKKWNRSWLDGSTSKVLAPHARGPDFNSQELI